MATNFRKGFSLVEMVVYIALLVVLLIIVVQVVFSVTRNNRIMRSARNIEVSAVEALERLNREIRNADSIDTTSSVLGSSPGVLSLDSVADGVASSVEFYLAGGRIRVRENGSEAGALTLASTTVTSLIFNRFSASSTEGVRITLTLESGTSTSYRSETFYSSVLVR